MNDADKLKLVATVMIRRLCVTSWVSPEGKPMPPSFKGDASDPVVSEQDENVFASLKKNDRALHDQIWTDAAAILEALERGAR